MAEGILPFKDLGKQKLLERCRELEFVDDVQDLRCTRCNRLTLEHWCTNCGHTLCPNCKRLLTGGRCRCPHCGQFIQHIEEQSADFKAKVNDLRAKCPNSKYGCPLVTTVKQLQEHLVGCDWTKEQVLPAVYRGSNTMQMLLEEMSGLKEQMRKMNGAIEFLLNELCKRQEVEEEIKKSVEMSVEDIKSRLNGLSSDLHYETTSLKVQFKDFDQIKMKELQDLKNTLTLDIKNKITTLEKTINEINHEKFKDHFVAKDEVMRLQEAMTEMKGSNKILIQMLDQKEDRFSQKVTKEVEALDAKIMTSESRMEAALTKSKQELQGKVEKSNEELKAQWQNLASGLNQRLEQHETSFNQKLSNEVKQLNEKINENKTSEEINGKENHAKMEAIKCETKKQEVDLKQQIATNVKIEKEIIKLNQEIDQLNNNTSEIKKIIDDTTKSLQVDYKTKVEAIQQMNPQLNPIEAFQRVPAIKQLLNRKSSVQQLVDSFLFGSAQEQMVFESLCLKWTIKQKDLVIPKGKGEREHVSDIFPVYGFQPKAQLKLTIHSIGAILLHLCFLDEAREGQEMAIRPLPMVTFIVKDLSGHNKHLIRYDYHLFKKSLKYNQFGYGIRLVKSEWRALVSPGAGSVEVLVLVEPMTIMNKPLSVDGSMTETIEHYSRKLEMAKEGLIKGHWSPPFLTHAGGYRVALDMRLNGRWNEGRLVAWIYFLSGESDSELGREYAHETSVTLINQWDAKKNITVKKQAKEASYYVMSIATHDAMGSGGYLVNDSLTYHVTVKPIK